MDLRYRGKHGGYRPGAGRPRTSRFQPHLARESFSEREPQHVTLRLRAGLPNLRRKDVFRALRSAVLKARRQGLAVAHYAVLSNHVHLIVESKGHAMLGRAMQSFGISFSKRLNAIAGRAGAVFSERYHVAILRTPTQVKNALRYVLTNEFKHRGGRGRVDLDEYSSGLLVSEVHWARLLGRAWRRLVGFPQASSPDEDEARVRRVAELIQPARTWLLRIGWMRA